MALNPEQKEKWLTALRSGEYQQGSNKLRTDDGKYCCLGVFAVCNNIPIDKSGIAILLNNEYQGYGLFNELMGEDTVDVLWKMNDKAGKSFLEIADYIEQNL